MDIAARITEIIAPSLEAMGVEVVRVVVSSHNSSSTLQIMLDRLDGVPITLDECAEASRTISVLLDVEDPISGKYTLEVGSPGMDRPLVRLADYERFAGHEAKIELRIPREGRRRFTGKIAGVDGQEVVLDLPEGQERFAFEGISDARLVLTDALIQAYAKGAFTRTQCATENEAG